MSGSKTKYYVSSSTFPMFDDSSRVNQYAAAMLDYTANSPIEHSEYIKSFYNTSKLRNYRGYLNWCEKSGYFNTFGKVTSNFYGDAKLDLTVVSNAIKSKIPLQEKDQFAVYAADISFFSEDFYIKYLATLAGKQEFFYNDGDLDYTIEYPTSTTIRAVLANGDYVEGNLPTGSNNTRFIEIKYSIIREIREEVYPEVPEQPEPEIPEEGDSNTEIDPEPEVIVKYETLYGYYHYQENTGISALDNLIKNNNSTSAKTFYPPIPLRSNTAWLSGNKAAMINKALEYMDIRKTNSDRKTGYDQLKEACSKMEKGSINDIDYITILFGVNLNSDDNSDQKYLFEFFYNAYFNYALKTARPNPQIATPLYAGSNAFDDFASLCKRGFASAGYSDGYFSKFTINCPSSNLNLTYSWGNADYFEQNGQWKPDAKIGDYGILAGEYKYIYSYTVSEPLLDDEGNQVYRWVVTGNWGGDNEEGYYEAVYHDVTYTKTVPYSLTFFCHQTSKNRFRLIAFTSLRLSNLVYHGKTVDTSAYEAINAASGKEDVQFDLTRDYAEDAFGINQQNIWFKLGFYKNQLDPNWNKPIIILKRVTATGEIDTPFIVPLEQGTFYEIGTPNQANIVPRSAYLIYNCWQKVKQKWYQRGFFKWVALAVAVVVAVFTYGSTSWLVTAVFYAAVATAVVIAVSIALDLLTKVLTALLGDRIGGMIGGILQSVWKGICAAFVAFGEWAGPFGFAIKIGTTIGLTVVNTDDSLQAGEGFGKALLKGTVNTGVQIGAAYAAGQFKEFIGNTDFMTSLDSLPTTDNMLLVDSITNAAYAGAYAGLSSFGSSFIDTGDFGEALKSGTVAALTTVAAVGVGSYLSPTFNAQFSEMINKNLSGESLSLSFETALDTITGAFIDQTTGAIVNPNTFVNLLLLSEQEKIEHKLKNLENDYQEFNNHLKAAQEMLDVLDASLLSLKTAEFVCKWQVMMNNLTNTMPEVALTMTPDTFITMSTLSGTDMCKSVLGSVTSFSEEKLSLTGYTPSTLYYTQTDNTLLWDVT